MEVVCLCYYQTYFVNCIKLLKVMCMGAVGVVVSMLALQAGDQACRVQVPVTAWI